MRKLNRSFLSLFLSTYIFRKPNEKFQRSHSFIPSSAYKKSIDLSKYNRKTQQESTVQFAYGLTSENKVLEERTKEKGNTEGLSKIMQMSFRKKSQTPNESD